MRFIKFIALTILVLLSVQIYAMPPHPDLIDRYQKEGRLKSLMNRADAVSTKMNINSPLQVFPASGVRRVPVLLVNYDTPYEASSDVFSFIDDIKKDNLPVYGLFILLLCVLLMTVKLNGETGRAFLKPFIPALYSFLFVFLISCSCSSEDDEEEFPTDPDVYDTLLNGESSSDLSVKKYYQDMSNGALNLQFDVYGPVKVSKAWDYYGENSGADDLHPGELAGEALRLMVSKYSSVNFASYDNDKNGEVDAVIIIHEGPGEEVIGVGSPTIWSHQWDLRSAALSGDGNGPVNAGRGVLFNVYTMQPEYTISRGDSSIGVFAHEFGHVLGLPDLYDTSGATNGVGDWSLMASGSWKGSGGSNDGSAPSPLLAWERYKIGGSSWLTITTLVSSTNQAIQNIETSKEVFKVVLSAASGQVQYLLIEGKKTSTSTQWYVPGPTSGLLITHIHEGVISRYTATNTVNAGSARVHGVNIVEADGTNLWAKSDTGTDGDLYKTTDLTNAIVYNDNTNYTTSSAPSGKGIVNITVVQSPLSMEFDVTP